jgi:hypothetical protein
LTQRFCFGKCGSLKQVPVFDVSQLLRTCQRHFKAYRFTSGKGGTALACYEEVLKKAPNNAEALGGLEKIEKKYVAWIEGALRRGKVQKALQYMAGLRKVNPKSPRLAAFEEQLQVPTPPVYVPKPVTLPIPQPVATADDVFRDRLQDGKFGPKMVLIPGGSFKIGDIQGGGGSDEKPVHIVTVKGFAMGRTEVTVGEFRRFVDATRYKTDA